MKNQPLPIDPYLDEILRTLERSRSLVVRSTPGSGKTTRLPPALLGAKWREDREILVLEPRRLAAKYAALRVADERGEEVGQTVGYQFRFENVGGTSTRLRFLTEGMLARKLLSEPKLPRVAAVVLDEFHERHLHTDTAIAYLKNLQATFRPDLRLVVMSATLDTGLLTSYLGVETAFDIETRQYPVEVTYLNQPPTKYLDQLVVDGVRRARDLTGDILVFLPGMGEIRRVESALAPLAREMRATVHPLHGDLSRDEQDRAIQKGEKRKIILSTNVAETSLTIEGVTVVIDSGLHRQASHSYWSGIPSLKTRATSRASAEQRAGRAGRLGPGHCFRLFTKADFDSRAAFEVPEIRRSDLAPTVLEWKSLGIVDARKFSWLEAPPPEAVEAAEQLLSRLGAVSDGMLTEIGRELIRLPIHPRLGRMLLEAKSRQVVGEAVNFVSELAEGVGDGARKVRAQLLSALGTDGQGRKDSVALARCVLAGFPDRVARKRHSASARVKATETELLFCSGGSAKVENAGLVAEGDTFVVLEVQEQGARGTKGQLRVHSVLGINPDWLLDLEPSWISESRELGWDEAKAKVVERDCLRYGELVLTESMREPSDPVAAAKILLKQVLGIDPSSKLRLHDWIGALGKVADAEVIESQLARLELCGATLDTDAIARVVGEQHVVSAKELRALDWPTVLSGLFPGVAGRLDRLCPLQISLPSGRRTRVHYRLGKPPWVESRLQDFFGMERGPAILDGKLFLTLHLLAPNQRAVQVTTDLAGFWDRAYPTIRKELSRKYPRHKWPENPRKP